MHLRRLELEEFRSYRRLVLDVEPGGLRLSGPNTSGKSTLLEAVAMLATTRSPRSTTEREVINWASGLDIGFPPYSRIRGELVRGSGEVEIEITLQADLGRSSAVRKQIKLNGRSVRAMDAVGTLKAVLFSPEDVMLVSGPPSGRRRYLDLTISQMDGGYLRALSRFNRVLLQRNSLLKSLQRERAAPRSSAVASQLAFWDGELVAYGSAIVARRRGVVGRLASIARERFRWLTGGGELEFVYRPNLDLTSLTSGAEGVGGAAAEAVVARGYERQLEEARTEEVRRGMSVVGPHRDDLEFAVGGMDLSTYGSRGQQRLGVVALKLAEADAMAEVAGEPPLLLLDDVLSELDANHRSLLTATAATLGSQVIVTATDDDLLRRPDLAALPWARVEAGRIEVGQE